MDRRYFDESLGEMIGLRKFTVLLLILVWNTAGIYATVCASRCASADYTESTAPASLAAPPSAKLAHVGATSDPSRPADYCVSNLYASKCVTGSFQTPGPELSYAQTLPTAFLPVAPAVQERAGLHELSPPGLVSGRLISQKHSLLRI